MIKNIFVNWRTTYPGVLAIVTGVVAFVSKVLNHTLTADIATMLIMGVLGGIGLLYAQDYTQGQKAHAESQAQIAELQQRSNFVPNAIESGDTSMLRKVPITPASVAPPIVATPAPVPVANPPSTP